MLTRLGEGQAAAPLLAEAEAMRKKSIEMRRAAAPAGDQVYRVNTPGMVQAKLLRHIDPGYSDEARMVKRQGSVMIDSAGKPWVVDERRALGSGLDEQAMLAVEAWQFAPATLNGQPVAVRATVEVSFRLQ